MTTSQPTFHCLRCDETYQQHWRDPDSDLCRACAAQARDACVFNTHPHHPEHPCSYGTEQPGEPCRYCGEPVPLDGKPCTACWLTFEGMALADIKAVFAGDGTFNVTPEVRP
ncbi:hypothetical protein HY68_36775 [Streptomyces sp. AcH 505]|uniref:hypothetical protein n=1 Tax=Streptomyces sp. AcH 505 TaxID=352211 RepID=UPI00059220D9|nr:hypothetical protein HY68_36775 [Streptomyces sp. AcH 505]